MSDRSSDSSPPAIADNAVASLPAGRPISDIYADSGYTDPFAWVWHERLGERNRSVLQGRLEGATLEALSDIAGGVSRERVRQIQLGAEKGLLLYAEAVVPDLRARIEAAVAGHAAVHEAVICRRFAVSPSAAARATFSALGLRPPRTWAGRLSGWWTREPGRLDSLLRELADQAPFEDAELAARATAIGLPVELPLEELLAVESSPLRRGPRGGWVHRTGESRDAAFLYLTSVAEPRPAADLAAALGVTEHSLREAMRRDPRFAQVRPDGTWALADWKHLAPARRYSNAEDAVLDVLTDLGPLAFSDLMTETFRRYPVSSWRVSQCLSSIQVGRTADGRYDLTARGALPVEEPEPRRPDNVAEQGEVIGIRMPVDHDLLRGSGLGVSRWVTWRLGLRQAPSSRIFTLVAYDGEIVIRRRTSTSSVSSLRGPVNALDLAEGCEIVLLLYLKSNAADIRHACDPASCAATAEHAAGTASRD